MTERQSRVVLVLIAALGAAAIIIILAFYNITDDDLWAKLSVGSSVWNTRHLPRHDVFAFTPTLPLFVEHEWGAGVIFYALLHWFGESSLIILRMVLMLGLLGLGFATGRRQGCDAKILMLLAVPCAACALTAFIPVARSHLFTFFFFAVTLYLLEELRGGASWPLAALPVVIMVWANIHGGFVAGLGVIGIYALNACVERKRIWLMIGLVLVCAAVTLINPYGVGYWRYLVHALTYPRPSLPEWHALPLFGWDNFVGFRIVFVLAVFALILGWKNVASKNRAGLAILAVTAFLGWHSRRHGPFLGVAALAYAGPYFEAALARRFNLLPVVAAVYVAMAFLAVWRYLPEASLIPVSPIGEDPVREADILSISGAKGNAAVPFAWGSYISWRLYPNIKVSWDGRYDAIYPESTFNLNWNFFHHDDDWLRLCKEFKVDYVLLDLQSDPLRPEDIMAAGYELIWEQKNMSALFSLPEHAALLQKTAQELPPYTVDPLDLSHRK